MPITGEEFNTKEELLAALESHLDVNKYPLDVQVHFLQSFKDIVETLYKSETVTSLSIEGNELTYTNEAGEDNVITLPIPTIGADNGTLVSQVGHGFLVGSPVYKNEGEFHLAIADENATVNDTYATNIVTEIVSPDEFKIKISGIVPINLSGYTGEQSVWLSQTSAGTYTNAEPTEGAYQQLGWYSGGLVYFNYSPGGEKLVPSSSPTTSYEEDTEYYSIKRVITGNSIDILVKIKENTTDVTNIRLVPLELIPAGNFKFFHFNSYVQSVDTLQGPYSESILNERQSVSVSFNKLMIDSDSEILGMDGQGGAIGSYSIIHPIPYGNSYNGGLADSSYQGDVLPIIDSTGLQATINYDGGSIVEYSFVISGKVWNI